jgi:hypothetical protein
MSAPVRPPISNYHWALNNIIESTLKSHHMYGPEFTSLDFVRSLRELPEEKKNTGVLSELLGSGLQAQMFSKEIDPVRLIKAMCDLHLNPLDIIVSLIKIQVPEDSLANRFFPAAPPNWPAVDDRQGIEFTGYLEQVQRLDRLLEPLLGLKTTITSPVDLPFSTPEARLYALVSANEFNTPYLILSPLMQRCRAFWFHDYKNTPEHYQTGARRLFLNSLLQYPLEGIFDDVLEPARQYFLDGAQLFSADPQSDGAGLDIHYLRLMDNLGIERLEFDTAQRRWLSLLVFKSGALEAGQQVLQSLFRAPDTFVECLVLSACDDDKAQSLFRGCLLNHMIRTRAQLATLPTLRATVDAYRETFIAHGYADIIKTKALDTLSYRLELCEAFDALGYLRHEEMSLNNLFVMDFQGRNTQDMFGADGVQERMMRSVITLGQRELVMDVIKHFFEGRSHVNPNLSTPAAMKVLLESGYVDIGKVLRTPKRFKKAWAMGVNQDLLLSHPKLYHHRALALEVDLGL